MTQPVGDADRQLTRWLESLKPSASLFCRAEVRATWGFSIGPRETSTFHLLTAGDAVLEVDGVPDPIHLTPGDFVLLPTGAAHAMRDSATSPLPSLQEAVAAGRVDGKWVRFGGDGERTVLICGVIGHVHRNLDAEITLGDLCRIAALSRSTLYERFEHAVGVPPMEYVRRTRLNRASELLRTTDAG